MKRYPYGLAVYPGAFRGIIVSPTKLCLQFEEPGVKLRLLGEDGKMLPKDPSTHSPTLPITVNEDKVAVVAVGCKVDVLFDMLDSILDSLELYGVKHATDYAAYRNRDFATDLKCLQQKLTQICKRVLPRSPTGD